MKRGRANKVFVSALRGSWDGWMPRDVMRRTEVLIIVEFKLRCCMRRWPLLVEWDFGKYFMIIDSVRPDQDRKWPRFRAGRRVDGRGLKAHPWRKRLVHFLSFYA